MSTLFRNNSPGALTLDQAVARAKAQIARRQKAAEEAAAAEAPPDDDFTIERGILAGFNPAKARAEFDAMAQAMARQGRGSDTEIAHVARGELVLPKQLQNPEVMTAIRKAAAAAGVPLGRLSVGNASNSINPATGAPEFGIGDFMKGVSAMFGGKSAQPAAPFAAPAPEVYGPNLSDAETGRRARVIFGETAGVYPALNNQSGRVFTPENWNQASTDELARARAYMGVVSDRNKVTHSANPDFSKPLDRLQWNKALEAAQTSRDMDQRIDPKIDGFYLRQQGSGQNLPYNSTLIPPIGPFTNVGGEDVPRGNKMYFDFFKW